MRNSNTGSRKLSKKERAATGSVSVHSTKPINSEMNCHPCPSTLSTDIDPENSSMSPTSSIDMHLIPPYLQECNPAICMQFPRSAMPPGVTILCNLLSEAAENSSGIVPRALQQRVENHPNGRSHQFPEYVWATILDPDNKYDDQWEHVVSLFEKATNLHVRGVEESGWHELVGRALNGVNIDQRAELR